jgi:hypothetical protein
MLQVSTPLILAVLGGVLAGLSCGLWVGRRRWRRRPSAQDTYLRAQAARLACAQHWARGGALSGQSEAWRPVCLGAAIAALLVPDDRDLARLLEQVHQDALPDPELANVWAQARGELDAARSPEPLGIAFLTGYRPGGSADWNYPELQTQARILLQNAREGALSLLRARRVQSEPAAGEPTQKP